jgi:hypothetical protein
MRIEYYINNELFHALEVEDNTAESRLQYETFEDYCNARETAVNSLVAYYDRIVSPLVEGWKKIKPVGYIVFESKMNDQEFDDVEPTETEDLWPQQND